MAAQTLAFVHSGVCVLSSDALDALLYGDVRSGRCIGPLVVLREEKEKRCCLNAF